MQQLSVSDQVIIVDRGNQYTTPCEDVSMLRYFQRYRQPSQVKDSENRKKYQIKGVIAKIYTSGLCGVWLPDHNKHIVIGPDGIKPANDYKDTFVRVHDENEFNLAISFYKKKGIDNVHDEERQDRIRYVRACPNYGLRSGSERLLSDNCSDLRDITSEVFIQEYKPYYNGTNPLSFIQPTTMTNTLEQLKFDKYVKANQDSIVKLSESIDSNLELLNDACAACGEFFSKVRTINQSMSRAFESCNKSLLNETFNRLKDYDKLFKLGVFSNLTTAMQMFISAAQKLND